MDSANARFMFNSTSANKPPGSGVMEYVENKHLFKELSKIHDWRKVLSNEHLFPITIDNVTWPSIEHYVLSDVFKDQDKSLFSSDDANLGKFRAKLKSQGHSYDEETLESALRIKFGDLFPDHVKILKATKNSLLTNWKRGNPVNTNEQDERYIDPNATCLILMKIRKELLQVDIDAKQAEPVAKVVANGESSSSRPHDQKANPHRDLKVLTKKDFDDFDDFVSKYDKSMNVSINILTVYERTNVLGVRMEQLAMGAAPLIDEQLAFELKSIRLIAMEEFKQRKIPFVICRNMPTNKKEYWRLEDMILCS